MDKQAVLDRITGTGIIPVIRAQSADEAAAAIAAIQKGGVSVLEITMTVPGAVELIRDVARRATDALVGAGTVLDPAAARACIDAGARFVVSPALDVATIETCREAGIAVLPGALTPTEVVTAWNAGADLVKVFPANALGGASYIKSLKAPLPQIPLVPTGGVNLQTAKDFIKAGAAALGVGADLVDLQALRRGEAEVITERARQFLALVREARTA
ncbi:MAG: bifunctional 4-hydroxy-2-oxoglutarate aldolase/2-dehydro-3-deoxy-phosphogluconate aldolase [Vicinamibacterales bacterium]|jgi:2-dehydro-3-deoxyphosphogluconate aldolase/(4S)-4-hydroxy-2-oxoglutarate aldolase